MKKGARMKRVILCETKPAKTSYIFQNTKIEVFSYEELCFYIYNNAALIAMEHIGITLFHWIANDLKLEDLAEELRDLKEKDTTDLTDLLTAILTYKEYYSIPEVKEFIFQMERMKSLPVAQFRKLQADGFLRYRKYIRAAAIYDEILEKYGALQTDDFLSAIYHNKAVALAYNFELNEAAEAFIKAYQKKHNKESIYGYLLLMATIKDKSDVEVLAKYYDKEDFLENIYEAIEDTEDDAKGSPIYRRMEKAIFHYQKNNLMDYSKRMDAVIEELKSDFREQTI